ncbi:hypothetical protein IZ6_13350 [Terrihabitans soli]|uniref:Uncharacterized protein n=1 Tax=Terrihabitans soli TaxID=708113 RepID=A0A6S6QUG0_9HYPH|nr:hypothetical protein [Terrihabitans soli]BCJ90600.1 hypothetical protein IZ6_13350 [Terrihabitans soli]
MEDKVSKRRGRALVALLVLAFFVLIVIGLVSAFKLGVSAGMASAGTAIALYQIPAMVFDWPRLTLDDVFAFFGAVFEWFLDLFSW